MELCLLIRCSTWIFLSVFGFRSRYEAGKCHGDVPEQSEVIQKVISFFFPFDEKITWNGKERNNYLRFLGEDALLTANRGATCFSMLPGSSSQIPSTPQDLSCHLHSSQLDWMSAIRSPNRWHKIHFRIKMRSCKISYWSQSSTLSSITLSTIASTVLSERQRSDSSRSAKTNSLSCLKEQSDYFD